MTTRLTDAEKIRKIPWQIAGGTLNSIFCVLTVFGPVFVLFLDELGLPKAKIGVILSFAPFSGIIALFISSRVARTGYKKVFLTFFGLRKFVVALILFTPLILQHFGANYAFFWVAGIMGMFSLCRAIAETAVFPWTQEVIPNSIRGKVSAISFTVSNIFNIISTAVAGYVIGHGAGLDRFMILMAIGIGIGMLSVVTRFFVPGGAPDPGAERDTGNVQAFLDTLRDGNFRVFLIAIALMSFAVTPLFSFAPLFLKEQIGIPTGNVIYLQIAASAGGLLSSYLWGWAADRYGNKPIMLLGLGMLAMLPVFLWLIPRHPLFGLPAGLIAAILVTGYQGVAGTGWFMGYFNYLFVSAVPEEKKSSYMPVFYAWSGIMNGSAPLLAGNLLDISKDLSESAAWFPADPYVPLFLFSFVLILTAGTILSKARSDGAIRVSQFLGMFFTGNPFMALSGMVRYRFPPHERSRISTTQKMGDARNPLNINELLEALEDPGFNVRYEAIISLARMRPSKSVVDALVKVLEQAEPDLRIAAAWALGKLGDQRAIPALRETLNSVYPLVRARSARALASLNDRGSIPQFLERLGTEEHESIRIAYGSALGTLKEESAVGPLLGFLDNTEEDGIRAEVALALARIIGQEAEYIKLWRSIRGDTGTAATKAVMNLRKFFPDADNVSACADTYAQGEISTADGMLGMMIADMPQTDYTESCDRILSHAAARLMPDSGDMQEKRRGRDEYFLLAVHAVEHGARQEDVASVACAV